MGYEEGRPSLGYKERTFALGDKQVVVAWESIDPVIMGWPEKYHDVGVLFISHGESTEVRITNHIPESIQGYSALHEQICMVEKFAACPDVEALVVASITDVAEKAEYIEFRKRMFRILLEDDQENDTFRQSLSFLESL